MIATEEELRYEARAQMMLDEWHITGQDVGIALTMLDEIPPHSQRQFWVCALEFTSRTNKYERYRANLVVLMKMFLQHRRLSTPVVVGCLVETIDRACRFESWNESPGLWRNLGSVTIDLMVFSILSFEHVVDICSPFFQWQQEYACRDLLLSIMRGIQTTHQYQLYNPQVGLTLHQALNGQRGHPKGFRGRLHTIGEFIETLAY